jgi:hypothetical protein
MFPKVNQLTSISPDMTRTMRMADQTVKFHDPDSFEWFKDDCKSDKERWIALQELWIRLYPGDFLSMDN